MRYEGRIYRPPSEANAFILQATIGCSHNLCTYCDMYRDKTFRVRPLEETLEDVEMVRTREANRVEKVFVADGDALVMDLDHWLPILKAATGGFPRLRQISCYATANNINGKSDEELKKLRENGLELLYLGPESGDPVTLKKIVKGDTYESFVEAARRAHQAGLAISVIILLGAGGVSRSEEHARASAQLITNMDPEYLAALTLTPIPGTPLFKLGERNKFKLPDVHGFLEELRLLIDGAAPTDALFRTNHASNYLALGGRLPADRERILQTIDAALAGKVSLRPEWFRGL